MKLIIAKEHLLKALQLAEDIISSRNTMSILSNILLETDSGLLKIISTDMETTIKIHLPANIEKQGAITIYARKLTEVIRELPNDDIELNLDEDKILNIKSKSKTVKAKFKIKGIAKEEYPVLPALKADTSVSLPQAAFKSMIRKTIFSVSTDEIQGNISGIKLELKAKKMRLVATDARRLALMDFRINTESEIQEVIIPQKVLNELMKILAEQGNMDINVSEKQIYFKIDNIELISRLIDGKFPDYNQVIPKSFEKEIMLETGKILDSLKRVSVMASEKQTSKIVLKFSANSLEIVAQDPELGEAREPLDIVYDKDPFDIAFSSEYLLDALKVIGTANVKVSFNSNTSASLLREEKNEDFICLVMPIKLN